MTKRSFTEDDLRLAVFGDLDGFSVVKDDITDTGRWDVHHTAILKEDATGKLYRVHYSRGATEMQDEGPQFHTNEVAEVEAFETTVTDYREVK